MSRVGKKPILVPAGVDVKLNANSITVKGPKGTLSRDLHKEMIIEHKDGVITVNRPSDSKCINSFMD